MKLVKAIIYITLANITQQTAYTAIQPSDSFRTEIESLDKPSLVNQFIEFRNSYYQKLYESQQVNYALTNKYNHYKRKYREIKNQYNLLLSKYRNKKNENKYLYNKYKRAKHATETGRYQDSPLQEQYLNLKKTHEYLVNEYDQLQKKYRELEKQLASYTQKQ